MLHKDIFIQVIYCRLNHYPLFILPTVSTICFPREFCFYFHVIYTSMILCLHTIQVSKMVREHICSSGTSFINYLQIHPFSCKWPCSLWLKKKMTSCISSLLWLAGFLGWFHKLVIVDAGAINIDVHVPLWYTDLESFG